MKTTTSSGISKTIYHTGIYLRLFGIRYWQNFEISQAINENGHICENKDALNNLNSYSSSQLLFAKASKRAVKGKQKGRGVKLY